uniref:Uncharacterized protein n=1 Tax=Oryza brachyantha TaxID=4533 RepID=J3LAW3_ORYBR
MQPPLFMRLGVLLPAVNLLLLKICLSASCNDIFSSCAPCLISSGPEPSYLGGGGV